jgi:hypothetical protein
MELQLSVVVPGKTPGCGCGVAEVANDGDQDCGGVVATGVEWRRSRGSKMRSCERIKEVEQDSWTHDRTKKGHG